MLRTRPFRRWWRPVNTHLYSRDFSILLSGLSRVIFFFLYSGASPGSANNTFIYTIIIIVSLLGVERIFHKNRRLSDVQNYVRHVYIMFVYVIRARATRDVAVTYSAPSSSPPLLSADRSLRTPLASINNA